MAFSVVASYSSPLVRPLSSAARFELVYAVSEAALFAWMSAMRGASAASTRSAETAAPTSPPVAASAPVNVRAVYDSRGPSDADRRDESLAHGPRPW